MVYTHRYESPLGTITLASDGTALIGAWFDGQKHFGSTLSTDCREEFIPIFKFADEWLDIYFSGEDPGSPPPVVIDGSAFQKAVCEVMRAIPYGRITTYGAIAKAVSEKRGRRIFARAVGGAVGRNPVSIFIPCHRVVAANGSLTGYAAGIERKRYLLSLENGTQPAVYWH